MNERIKELAGQAWNMVGDTNRPLLFAEKFAELIVRECVRHFNEDYQRDFDTLWREDLSKSIKDHFGFEE